MGPVLLRPGRRVRIGARNGEARLQLICLHRLQRTIGWRARDTGIRKSKQLQGKRVGFVVGSPLSTRMLRRPRNSRASPRSKIVEFAAMAHWKGMSTRCRRRLRHDDYGPARELENSPARHHLAATAAQGRAGLGSAESRRFFTSGSNCGARSPRKSGRKGQLPLSEISLLSFKSNDEIYAVTKAMIEGYDSSGCAPEQSVGVKAPDMRWLLPCSPGS